ncbi:MAG: (2Fe-2S)-binding protein, partial [Candidatus Aminicenantes bacterium]|nr:(2Fe-2S)-binding protein [Candidatus Aminicenantes bacterium]
LAGEPSTPERAAALVGRGVLPPHFLDVSDRLRRLSEAVGTECPARGRFSPAPVLVAGGTDLFITRAEELRDADLSFLSRRADLREIRLEDGVCRVGAAAPLADVEESPVLRRVLPGLGRHFARIASPAVRNRATVGGNIVNASPAGDLSVIFLALDASLVLREGRRRRVLPLRDFFRGYKLLDLGADEMVAEIAFPVPDAATRFHFEKVGRREYLDIAGVSTAARLRVQNGRILDARVAAGSVAPVPLYLRTTSAFLEGRPVTAATARAAADMAASEASPVDDVRGSAEYRRALLSRLILAHFLTLFPERIREEDLG